MGSNSSKPIYPAPTYIVSRPVVVNYYDYPPLFAYSEGRYGPFGPDLPTPRQVLARLAQDGITSHALHKAYDRLIFHDDPTDLERLLNNNIEDIVDHPITDMMIDYYEALEERKERRAACARRRANQVAKKHLAKFETRRANFEMRLGGMKIQEELDRRYMERERELERMKIAEHEREREKASWAAQGSKSTPAQGSRAQSRGQTAPKHLVNRSTPSPNSPRRAADHGRELVLYSPTGRRTPESGGHRGRGRGQSPYPRRRGL